MPELRSVLAAAACSRQPDRRFVLHPAAAHQCYGRRAARCRPVLSANRARAARCRTNRELQRREPSGVVVVKNSSAQDQVPSIDLQLILWPWTRTRDGQSFEAMNSRHGIHVVGRGDGGAPTTAHRVAVGRGNGRPRPRALERAPPRGPPSIEPPAPAAHRPMLRALVLAVGLGVAHPHGFITTPKSRNTLVCDKIWPDYLKHYNSDNFVCKTDRESHCPPMPGKKEKDCQGSSTGKSPGVGVPLEPFCSAGGYASGGKGSKLHKDAEAGLNSHGPPQANYTAGELVEMVWQVAANHGGKYQYRICTDGSDTEECFQRHVLQNDKGETWMEMSDKAKVGTKFSQKMRIPSITCERCTLSFRWDGLHESVIFASCADITISGGGPAPPPHPKPPSPSPSPSPHSSRRRSPPPPPGPRPAPPGPPAPPHGEKTCPHCHGDACGCSWVKKDTCKGKTSKNCGSCCTCCCCNLKASEVNGTAGMLNGSGWW